MEFFALADTRTTEADIQKALTIRRLPEFCDFFSMVFETGKEAGATTSLWGQFQVHREPIRGGVRFTLPDCPNTMAWTITTGFPPAPEEVVIHCTMSRTEHDSDFIESIDMFMASWKKGIEAHL